jgi:hypothetical protein
MANQHPEVLDFVPPSLYSPSPARQGPRHFDVPWNADDEMVECPVPLCELVRKTGRTARAFSPDITTKRLFQWRHSIARKVRTLLEVRQTLGHGEATDGVLPHRQYETANPGHGR